MLLRVHTVLRSPMCASRHIAAALANNGIATYVFDYNQHLSFTPPALQAGHFMELALLWDKPCFVSYVAPCCTLAGWCQRC